VLPELHEGEARWPCPCPRSHERRKSWPHPFEDEVYGADVRVVHQYPGEATETDEMTVGRSRTRQKILALVFLDDMSARRSESTVCPTSTVRVNLTLLENV